MRINKCMGILALSMLFTTVLLAQDAKKEPPKNIESIRGSWKVSKVTSGTQEVAKNPTSGQWIAFRSDGTYVNHATELDSGSYRLNENLSSLYLESHVHPDPDNDSQKRIIEYKISLAGNNMTLQRKPDQTKRDKHDDRMKYHYVRVGNADLSTKKK